MCVCVSVCLCVGGDLMGVACASVVSATQRGWQLPPSPRNENNFSVCLNKSSSIKRMRENDREGEKGGSGGEEACLLV